MFELIEVLKAIEDNNSIKYKKYLTDGNYNDLPDLIKRARRFANELLITSLGTPNSKRIKILKDNGFNVFAGEKDSFGWLTGCVKTKKGIIVFG